MKIRSKLFLIILGFTMSVAALAGVNIAFNRQLGRINEEKLVLQELESSLRNLQLHVNVLLNSDMAETYTLLKNQKNQINSIYDQLDSLSYIRSRNETSEELFTNILFTREFIEEGYSDLEKGIARFNDGLIAFYGSNVDFMISELFSVTAQRREGYSQFSYEADKLIRVQTKVSDIIDVAMTNIERNNQEIETQITTINKKISRAGNIVASIFYLMVMIFSVLVARSISHTVNKVENRMNLLSTGDLSVKVEIKEKDEIGKISRNIQGFVDKLNESIVDITEISHENTQRKEILLASTEKNNESIGKISDALETIGNEIKELDNLSKKSHQSSRELGTGINAFKTRIDEQLNKINDSTSSVTEMIASVTNVARLTENNRKVNEELVDTVDLGGASMEATNLAVANLADFIDDIQSVAGIIQNIAAQTNLLAMNAAIEAAHAGESGKGFGVVADEIRKLAGAASNNSKNITEKLKGMTAKIHEATSAGEGARKAFTEINSKVEEVAGSFGEISTATRELNEGGKYIQEAMQSLETISLDVNRESEKMAEDSARVVEVAKRQSEVSVKVSSQVGGISEQMAEIAAEVDEVSLFGHQLSGISEKLDEALGRFKQKV